VTACTGSGTRTRRTTEPNQSRLAVPAPPPVPFGPCRRDQIFRGSYAPPLGDMGERLDRLLLLRVAEATIRSFMRRLEDSLTGADLMTA